jgi:NhaA family Na+:H+ antiporter
MKERFANILMAVSVLCAVVMTGLVAQRTLGAGPVGPVEGARHKNWRAIAQSGHKSGPANAPVVLVEFFDFQCPACRRMSYSIDSVLGARSDVRLIRRHFPLREAHPKAFDLAIGGVCADRQHAFPAYYRSAFDQQREVGAATWPGVASLVNPVAVDTNVFKRCLTDPAAAAIVTADVAAGNSLDITGTPSILVNDRLYKGSRSAAALDSLISQAQR